MKKYLFFSTIFIVIGILAGIGSIATGKLDIYYIIIGALFLGIGIINVTIRKTNTFSDDIFLKLTLSGVFFYGVSQLFFLFEPTYCPNAISCINDFGIPFSIINYSDYTSYGSMIITLPINIFFYYGFISLITYPFFKKENENISQPASRGTKTVVYIFLAIVAILLVLATSYIKRSDVRPNQQRETSEMVQF